MANEVLKLSILLDLKNQASAGTRAYIRDLRDLDRQGKLTLATLRQLRAQMNRAMSAKFGTNAVNQLKAIERQARVTQRALDKVRNDANRRGRRGPTGDLGPDTPVDIPRVVPRGRRGARDPFADPRTALTRAADLHDRYVDPVQQMGTILKQGFREQSAILGTYTDATLNVARAQSQFKLLNLTPDQNAKAFRAVEDNIRSLGVVTKTEGIQTLTDLHNAFASVDDAITALPMATKYQFAMKSIFGTSAEDVSNQLQNSFKFLELTGKTERAAMERGFDTITKIAAASGGRITGADFLAMAKTGAVASRDLDEAGLLHLSGVMQEMGASRTGTSLMSLRQAIVSGRMTQKSRNRLAHFGMLQEGMYEENPLTGAVKSMQPGAIIGSDMFQRDPLAFADLLKEKMMAKGVKFEYDEMGNLTKESARVVSSELSQIFSNRRAEDLMNTLMTQRGQIMKEANLARNAMGVEGMFGEAMEGPGKVVMWEKALERMKEEAGGPLLEALTNVMAAGKPLLDLMARFPNATAGVIGAFLGFKTLGMITETLSVFNRALGGTGALMNVVGGSADRMGGNITTASRTIPGFTGQLNSTRTAGTRFTETMATGSRATAGFTGSVRTGSTQVAGFTRNLQTATTGAGRFKTAMGGFSGLGSALGQGAIFAGVTGFLTLLVEMWGDAADRSAKTLENAKSLAQLYDHMAGRGDLFNAPGDLSRKPVYDTSADKFIEAAVQGRDLQISLRPETKTWFETFSNPTPFGMAKGQNQFSGPQFSPEAFAFVLKQNKNTAMLKDVNVLASVIEGLKTRFAFEDGSRMSGNELALVIDGLKQATDPAKFAAAMDIVSKREKDSLATPAFTQPVEKAGLAQPFTFGDAGRFKSPNIFDTGLGRPFGFAPSNLPFWAGGPRGPQTGPATSSFFGPMGGKPFGTSPFSAAPVAPPPPPPSPQPVDLAKLVNAEGVSTAFTNISGAVNPNIPAFTNLHGPASQLQGPMQGLIQPTSDAAGSLQKLTGPAGALPGPFSRIPTTASAVAVSLTGLSQKISSFKMPTINVATQYGSTFTGPTAKSNVGGAINIGPGRAIGGVVERDGSAYVHAGNVITPARVTKGLSGFQDLMELARASTGVTTSSAGAPNIHYAPVINVHGSASPETVTDIRQELNNHMKHIERLMTKSMSNGRVRA